MGKNQASTDTEARPRHLGGEMLIVSQKSLSSGGKLVRHRIVAIHTLSEQSESAVVVVTAQNTP